MGTFLGEYLEFREELKFTLEKGLAITEVEGDSTNFTMTICSNLSSFLVGPFISGIVINLRLLGNVGNMVANNSHR